MNIDSLDGIELRRRLAHGALMLQTGLFNIRIQSRFEAVSRAIELLYADYPLVPDGEFCDFHVEMRHSGGLRTWIRPQVTVHFDGHTPFAPLPADHAYPMLEWGLNWCAYTYVNSFLIIHAAVVEKNGRAAILPAPPGSGKSTLCAALVNRGWRLLSDELALVRLTDGQIAPLPRPVSLKNASIDIIQAYEPSALFSRKVFDTIKGTIAHMKPSAESIRRTAETARPAWIVFPKWVAGAPTSLTPMSKASGFMSVVENAFNYSRLGLQGFESAADLIDASTSYDFTYSVIDEAIAVFDELARQAE